MTARVVRIGFDSGETCEAVTGEAALVLPGRRVAYDCGDGLVALDGFAADRDGVTIQLGVLDADASPPVLRRERTRRVDVIDHRASDAPAVAPVPAAPLLGTVWALDRIVWAAGRESFPARSTDFTMTLFADGGVELALDCNRGSATFALGDGALRFESIATTRAYCGADSIDATVLGLLDTVARYAFDDDGALGLVDAMGLARLVWRPVS